jgi:hypothetical protein
MPAAKLSPRAAQKDDDGEEQGVSILKFEAADPAAPWSKNLVETFERKGGRDDQVRLTAGASLLRAAAHTGAGYDCSTNTACLIAAEFGMDRLHDMQEMTTITQYYEEVHRARRGELWTIVADRAAAVMSPWAGNKRFTLYYVSIEMLNECQKLGQPFGMTRNAMLTRAIATGILDAEETLGSEGRLLAEEFETWQRGLAEVVRMARCVAEMARREGPYTAPVVSYRELRKRRPK